MHRRPLADLTLSFLDTETTGLSPATGGRVCEVAVLQSKAGRTLGAWSSLVNPQCLIDPGAQRVHGITDAMVARSPTFERLAFELFRMLDGTVLVCHNAPFDLSFLEAEFRRAGLGMPELSVADTLTLARRHFRFESNRLGALALALGVDPDGWHRAQADVRLLSGVFERLLKDLTRKDIECRTLGDLLKLCGSGPAARPAGGR